MTRIFLVRHGETIWNAENRWQGHSPVPLNQLGQRQAIEVAEYIKKHIHVDQIISSDLPRAYSTSLAISSALNLPVAEIDHRLREIDVGNWQGHTTDEIVKWDPQNYQHFQSSFMDEVFPDGESRIQVRDRAINALMEICNGHRGKNIIIGTHRGTIMTVLSGLFGIESPPVPANCSITKLYFDQNGIWHFEGIISSTGEVLEAVGSKLDAL